MWESLAREAADDAGSPDALKALQSLQVVFSQSWEYDDPCGRLAERLGADPARRAYSGLGGSVPVRLASEAAAAMARGQLDLALLVGGEALATRRHLADPAWSYPPDQPRPYPITIDRHERKNGIFQAYLTFALLDTARRAHLGQSLDDRRLEIGRLMAPMSELAASQPEHAWFPIARTAEEISTVTAGQPDGGHPVHQADDRHHGRGHGRRGAVGHRGAGRRPGCARRPPGLPPGRRVRRGARHHGRPTRTVAFAGHGRGHAVGAREEPRPTRWPISTCTPASPAPSPSAPTPSGSRPTRGLTVTGGLPYHGGSGQQLLHPCPGGHGRGPAARPGRPRPGLGDRDAHDHHSASLWSTRPGTYVPSRAGRGAGHCPGDRRGGRDRPGCVTFSTVYGRQGPEWTALICDLPDGSRSYARLDEPAPADLDLVDLTVTLAPGDKGATIAHR